MIYILAYILLGISTGVIMRINGKADIAVSITCVFVWPLYWFAFVFAHFVGWMPAKCAWCGKSVAGHAHLDKWRAHYLDECDRHPLREIADANELALDAVNKQLAVTGALLEVETARANRLQSKLDVLHG